MVDKELVITGVGSRPTISGSGTMRVLDITADGKLTLKGLTVRDGQAWAGAGIRNAGEARLRRVAVRGSRAGRSNDCGRTPDPTCDYRRGPGNRGGAIDNSGAMSLTASTIQGNEAGLGGGIFNRGTMVVASSTVARNVASAWSETFGGGIFNGGQLRVRRSTVAHNRVVSGESYAAGGGLFNAGSLVVAVSTFSGNKVFAGNGGAGGAIANGSEYGPGPGDVAVIASTIAGNEARSWWARRQAGSGISNCPPGHCAGDGSFVVAASIVADNGRDCSGPFASGGNNLIGASTRACSGFVHRVDRDRVGSGLGPIDPRLAPLRGDGRRTRTRLPLAGSPAVGAAGRAPCATDRDQRGVTRPHGRRCDIGAVEVR